MQERLLTNRQKHGDRIPNQVRDGACNYGVHEGYYRISGSVEPADKQTTAAGSQLYHTLGNNWGSSLQLLHYLLFCEYLYSIHTLGLLSQQTGQDTGPVYLSDIEI